MIYDKISNIESYKGIHPGIYKGLKALKDIDFGKTEDGRYELEGDRLFMTVMTAELTEENNCPEAHRKYIDIQYDIIGSEKIGVASIDDVGVPVESDPSGDIWHYEAETEKLSLGNGRFLVLFPQDVHAPGISAADGKKVRKAVIKVKV